MEYVRTTRLDASVDTLSATSFALLAQFAREPCSAYALAVAMRRNMHYLWPRAESRIYDEVNRLFERGLLRGVAESTGRRARTVMHVTPAGRAALAAWLAGPAAPGLAIESEALLRVYFASLGSVADMQRALDVVDAEAAELMRVAGTVGDGYLAGQGIAQEQAHVRAMIHALLGKLALLLQAWVVECRSESAAWKDMSVQGKKQAAARRFRATQALLSAPRAGPARPAARGGSSKVTEPDLLAAARPAAHPPVEPAAASPAGRSGSRRRRPPTRR